MISERKLASAVGGKTARACDSCIKKRARWYCAADDAFLCQACDSSIHSAILLARRHERVRLKTASIEQCSDHKPSWNHGFKRKPRSPRKSSKSHGGQTIPIHLVPEIGMEENLLEENDEHEQLLYRVPIFDPFAAQVCVTGSCNDGKKGIGHNEENEGSKYLVNYDREGGKNVNSGFNQSKKDTEFEAHVECLLREGLGGESFDMETLGLLDCGEKEPHSLESSTSAGTVRLDDAQAVMGNAETDITGETFELNFNDYDSHVNCAVNPDNEDSGVGNGDDVKEKKNISLALDYEAVIAAWADQKSPWINGGRPEIDPNGGWSDCMDARGGIHYQTYGETGGSKILTGMFDGGREERVLRYREKRRTRLFSKKIRYEVRKLNAEKRPRVKGRFVKTESLAANSSQNISPFH